jgi:PAS domain S-box-containing protein
MQIFDMQTVMFMSVVVTFFCAIVLTYLWLEKRKRYPGIEYWLIGWLFWVLGSILMTLRGLIPDWASIVVGNLTLLIAIVGLYYGLCRFFGRKSPVWVNIVIIIGLVAFIFVHSYFTFVHNILLYRSFNTSTGMALAFLLGAWLNFSGVSPTMRPVARSVGFSFLLLALLSVFRIFGLLVFPQGANDFFRTSGFDVLMVALITGADIFLVFNLVLLVNQRLFVETQQMEAAISKSERELQAVFKTTAVGFAVLSNRVFKEANDAACRMVGYSRKEIIGNSIRLLYPTEEEFRNNAAVYEEVAQQGTATIESRFLHKNGDILSVILTVAAFDKNDLSLGVVLGIIDNTERKKAEEALREEIKIRARFLDILAHELKGPLSPIMASSGMLADILENSTDERLKKLSGNISSATRTLSSRLDELLESARYSKGEFTLNLQPTDVVKFIHDVVTRYGPFVEQTQHKLIVKVGNTMPKVALDQSRIEQVLINLLSNASKYSQPNTNIELSAGVEGDRLLLKIRDEGKGLSELDQQNIFRPYYRLIQDRKSSPGLGLGLSICKQIVEAHGGVISVTSKPGKGSTFIVSLPLK